MFMVQLNRLSAKAGFYYILTFKNVIERGSEMIRQKPAQNEKETNVVSDTARVEDCLCKISNSSQHLLSLINDVLDMSRIESGKVTANSAPMNMIDTTDECAAIIDGQLQSGFLFLFIRGGQFADQGNDQQDQKNRHKDAEHSLSHDF